MGSSKPLFRELDPDDVEDRETTEIESVCPNCMDNGVTRILLTKIPFYKEVVLMSFECHQCGHKNNEIQSGGKIDEEGVRIVLEVKTLEDLNRQVVKSDYTSVKIPHIDFEIPAQTQKGEVTTVEGIISRSVAGLEQDQVLRRIQHPEAAAKIDDFIQVLNDLKSVQSPYKMIFEDISGNCFIENPNAPSHDLNSKTNRFKRNKEQDHVLGIFSKEEIEAKDEGVLPEMGQETITYEDLQAEVLSFHTNCPSCSSPCDTNMKVTKIPHFKEVVIMATSCDICGHKTNEVKSACGVEDKGIRIEVKIRGPEDFTRDVLKSETCSLAIPEIELEAGSRTLSGKFTTIEGLLVDMKQGLERGGSFFCIFNDSCSDERSESVKKCIRTIESVLKGDEEITLILDDPAGNSYIQCINESIELDEGIKISKYERNYDQNEELGLNDMKTEGYEDDPQLN